MSGGPSVHDGHYGIGGATLQDGASTTAAAATTTLAVALGTTSTVVVHTTVVAGATSAVTVSCELDADILVSASLGVDGRW